MPCSTEPRTYSEKGAGCLLSHGIGEGECKAEGEGWVGRERTEKERVDAKECCVAIRRESNGENSSRHRPFIY